MRLGGYGWLAGTLLFLLACGDEEEAPRLLAGVYAAELLPARANPALVVSPSAPTDEGIASTGLRPGVSD